MWTWWTPPTGCHFRVFRHLQIIESQNWKQVWIPFTRQPCFLYQCWQWRPLWNRNRCTSHYSRWHRAGNSFLKIHIWHMTIQQLLFCACPPNYLKMHLKGAGAWIGKSNRWMIRTVQYPAMYIYVLSMSNGVLESNKMLGIVFFFFYSILFLQLKSLFGQEREQNANHSCP